ncbi:TetR/AcrR family transcriptional regulator, partial [Phocaeicola coprophilus]|nr:TetR/AcrR family transcriptional regulator [Phocaeicola coprophilus]
MTTKENIIEAFWKIYAHKPLEKITIQELMDKAGYHRSVFYVYFKDIYDLLEQEENDIIDKLNEILPYIFYSIKNNHILPNID